MYQLGLLACALNRTLVLPNVHKGWLAACECEPFGLYSEADALDKLGIQVRCNDALGITGSIS